MKKAYIFQITDKDADECIDAGWYFEISGYTAAPHGAYASYAAARSAAFWYAKKMHIEVSF